MKFNLYFFVIFFGFFSGFFLKKLFKFLCLDKYYFQNDHWFFKYFIKKFYFFEFFSASVCFCLVKNFGFCCYTAFSLLLVFYLVLLSTIDAYCQLLPDLLTLSLLWIGLLINAWQAFAPTREAILGAILGYCFFWLLAVIFKKLRHIDGLGHGDFKLLAALGAWFGCYSLPILVFIAAFTGSIFGIALTCFKKNKTLMIPFGPFLSLGAFILLIFNNFEAFLRN